MEHEARKPYPSDVSDDEWAFVAPYLTLMRTDAAQRVHEPREVFNALRWIVRTGASWRFLPTNFPPCEAVYQQTRRWIEAARFRRLARDYERLPDTVAGFHFVAFACLMLHRLITLAA